MSANPAGEENVTLGQLVNRIMCKSSAIRALLDDEAAAASKTVKKSSVDAAQHGKLVDGLVALGAIKAADAPAEMTKLSEDSGRAVDWCLSLVGGVQKTREALNAANAKLEGATKRSSYNPARPHEPAGHSVQTGQVDEAVEARNRLARNAGAGFAGLGKL